MRAKTSESKANEGESGLLRDHICKEMCPLVEARMALIPRTPGKTQYKNVQSVAQPIRETNALYMAPYAKSAIKPTTRQKCADQGILLHNKMCQGNKIRPIQGININELEFITSKKKHLLIAQMKMTT